MRLRGEVSPRTPFFFWEGFYFSIVTKIFQRLCVVQRRLSGRSVAVLQPDPCYTVELPPRRPPPPRNPTPEPATPLGTPFMYRGGGLGLM